MPTTQKKKFKPKNVIAEPGKLVVLYTVVLSEIDEDGNVVSSSQSGMKRKEVPVEISQGADPTKLAAGAIKRCSLMNPKKKDKYAALIRDMMAEAGMLSNEDVGGNQTKTPPKAGSSGKGVRPPKNKTRPVLEVTSTRNDRAPSSAAPTPTGRAEGSTGLRVSSARSARASSAGNNRSKGQVGSAAANVWGSELNLQEPKLPNVSFDNIGKYREMLYGDKQARAEAASAFRALSMMDAPGVAECEDRVFQALARVFADEARGNMVLSMTILDVFHRMADYGEMRDLLLTLKIGSRLLMFLDDEGKRYTIWQQEMRKAKAAVAGAEDQEAAKKRYSDLRYSTVKKVRIQDLAIHLALGVLMRMGEPLKVQQKMVRARTGSVVTQLLEVLKRRPLSPDLGLQTLQFLLRLTPFSVNVDTMINSPSCIPRLMSLCPGPRPAHTEAVLGILGNLALHKKAASKILESSFLPRVAGWVKDSSLSKSAIRLLYVISRTRGSRAKILKICPDLLPDVVSVILGARDVVPEVPAALVVNLCSSPSALKYFSVSPPGAAGLESDRVRNVIGRAVALRDPLLWRIVRMLALPVPNPMYGTVDQDYGMIDGEEAPPPPPSLPSPIIPEILDFLDGIMDVLLSAKTDLLVEVLGVFCALEIPGFAYARLSKEYRRLLPLLVRLLRAQDSDDVVQLACGAIAVLASDPDIGQQLVAAQAVEGLARVVLDSGHDGVLCASAVHSLNRALVSPDSFKDALGYHGLVDAVIAHVYSPHPGVASAASDFLDRACNVDPEWRLVINNAKFRLHNREWLQAQGVEGSHGEEGYYEDAGDLADSYGNAGDLSYYDAPHGHGADGSADPYYGDGGYEPNNVGYGDGGYGDQYIGGDAEYGNY